VNRDAVNRDAVNRGTGPRAAADESRESGAGRTRAFACECGVGGGSGEEQGARQIRSLPRPRARKDGERLRDGRGWGGRAGGKRDLRQEGSVGRVGEGGDALTSTSTRPERRRPGEQGGGGR
jgi:hypothetical protein